MFLREVIDGLGVPTTGSDGEQIHWVIKDQQTGKALEPSKTLEANGVRDGDHLHLCRASDQARGTVLEVMPSIHGSVSGGNEGGARPVREERAGDRQYLPTRLEADQKTMMEAPADPKPADGVTVAEGIKCPTCGSENPPGKNFCQTCGNPFDPAYKPTVFEPPSAESVPSNLPSIPGETILPPDHRLRNVLLVTSLLAVLGVLVAIAYKHYHRPNVPLSVALSPTSGSLTESKTLQFEASVNGSSNQAVQWSINPALGTVSPDGLYTAPSSIPVEQTVTVTATCKADPTNSSSATVTLKPTLTELSVGVRPPTVSLGASRAQRFEVTVSGSSNQAVRWSIIPEVGGISHDGVYTAPPSIPTPKTITVTATSEADPRKSASAVVALTPPVVVSPPKTLAGGPDRTPPGDATVPPKPPPPEVSVSMSPPSVSLGASRAQKFEAIVSGSFNHTVRWSRSPAIGNVAQDGVYTAPSQILAPQTVTVTAASEAQPSKFASAAITLEPPPVTAQPEPVRPRPEPQHPNPVYGGPPRGTMTWSGQLEKNGTVTIDGHDASSGSLQGDLPGVPVMIDIDNKEIAVAEAPAPENGWKRLVLRSKKQKRLVVTIQWAVIP